MGFVPFPFIKGLRDAVFPREVQRNSDFKRPDGRCSWCRETLGADIRFMAHRKKTSKALFRDGSRDCLDEGRVLGCGGWREKGDMRFGSCSRVVLGWGCGVSGVMSVRSCGLFWDLGTYSCYIFDIFTILSLPQLP